MNCVFVKFEWRTRLNLQQVYKHPPNSNLLSCLHSNEKHFLNTIDKRASLVDKLCRLILKKAYILRVWMKQPRKKTPWNVFFMLSYNFLFPEFRTLILVFNVWDCNDQFVAVKTFQSQSLKMQCTCKILYWKSTFLTLRIDIL